MANQYTKKKENNRKEITWNIINSGLAAGLVFLGALTNGKITPEGIFTSVVAGLIVAFTQFQDYWKKEKKEYCSPKVFKFL